MDAFKRKGEENQLETNCDLDENNKDIVNTSNRPSTHTHRHEISVFHIYLFWLTDLFNYLRLTKFLLNLVI